MLIEATLEALRPCIEGATTLGRLDESSDRAQARLDRTFRVVQRETVANEALLRSMIRLTVEGADSGGEKPAPRRPRRGYRRIQGIELALEPAVPSWARKSTGGSSPPSPSASASRPNQYRVGWSYHSAGEHFSPDA